MGIRALGQRFRTLLGIVTGMNPNSRCEAENKTVIRRTAAYQNILTKGGSGVIGSLTGTAAATASFTVADNDFTTGRAPIQLGPHVLNAGLDYIPGIGLNDTASNIRAAINALPGFGAAGALAVISVTGPKGPDPVTFVIKHLGTKTNFTAITPNTGFMTPGTTVSAPVLS